MKTVFLRIGYTTDIRRFVKSLTYNGYRSFPPAPGSGQYCQIRVMNATIAVMPGGEIRADGDIAEARRIATPYLDQQAEGQLC